MENIPRDAREITRAGIAVAGLLVSGWAFGETAAGKPTFHSDVEFLNEHTGVVLLKDGGAAVAVAPAYQGRVMTSTYDADNGPGFGWINRKAIEAGVTPLRNRRDTPRVHIHVFGGEERFWMGPEGGQFGIFYEPGTKFDWENWFTPACMDTEAFDVTSQTGKEVAFAHRAELQNWTGTKFDVGISRIVRLRNAGEVENLLGVKLPDDVRMVAYESDNRIKNLGNHAWTKDTGLLSIWILGMYPPSRGTTVLIPLREGEEKDLGPKVNDLYFGKVPPECLQVRGNVLFFKGDGERRGKIGVSPQRAKGILGSYDRDNGILTIVKYSNLEKGAGYVNSMREWQKDPLRGDVINSYNDGPPSPGEAPFGPFYELETSSPAAQLAPGEEMRHVQTTVHLSGSKERLNELAQELLGVNFWEIKWQ